MRYWVLTACRSCGNPKLTDVMKLGDIFIVNFGEKKAAKAPLDLVICDAKKGGCGLLQLGHTVNQELLFRHYYYKSGVNRTMRDALAEIVQGAIERVDLNAGDVVVDIGCNDGTLLKMYPHHVKRVGFEPARNLVGEARQGGNLIVNDFFTAKNYPFRKLGRKPKVITAISMFYDLEDPNGFLEGIKRCLAVDGVCVIQQNYLPAMLERLGFDNIVHEHLEYYSVTTLSRLLARHGLTIEDVEFNDLNGGSFRVYVKDSKSPSLRVRPSVRKTLQREAKMGLDELGTYKRFARKVDDLRSRLHRKIGRLVGEGKQVYVYGASTRGNTLLQVCGLDSKLIRRAVERNPAKWGKRTTGTGILVISEEEARRDCPEYMLILPWHFLGEFVSREWDYLANGGKFIVPLPKPCILSVSSIK